MSKPAGARVRNSNVPLAELLLPERVAYQIPPGLRVLVFRHQIGIHRNSSDAVGGPERTQAVALNGLPVPDDVWRECAWRVGDHADAFAIRQVSSTRDTADIRVGGDLVGG